MPKKHQPDEPVGEGVVDLVFSPPESKALARPSPPKSPPETALGIKPSRFIFVNHHNRQRIQAYTGVIEAATALIGAQTGLEKAKAKLLNVGQEIAHERKQGELETLQLDNQIETETRKQRLSPLREERDRAELQAEIRKFAGQDQSDGHQQVSPEAARKKVFAAVQELEQEMQRVLIAISNGKDYDELDEQEQEQFDRVKHTYADLIDRKYDQLEKTE